jgi:hypothetical protein
MLITIAKNFPPPNGTYVNGVPAEHQPISAETKQMLGKKLNNFPLKILLSGLII